MSYLIQSFDAKTGTFAGYVEVAEEPPARNERGYWVPRYRSAPPFVVHGKFHRFDKPVPATVRGTTSRELLVQFGDGTWTTVDMSDTVEGRRFKKLLKGIESLIKICKEVAKQNAKASRERAEYERKVERLGECPACGNDQVVRKTGMVLHGYERPGHGYTIGRCFGVGYKPLEVSDEGLRAFIKFLQDVKTNREEQVKNVATVTEMYIPPRWRGDKPRTLKKGVDKGFDDALKSRIALLESEIKAITQDLALCARKLETWQPRPWPRKK
jgi:hypothetical protein